jgi:hypothetical protein
LAAKLQKPVLGQRQGLAHAFDAVCRHRLAAFLQEITPETDLGAQQGLAVARAPTMWPMAFGIPLILDFHKNDL